MALGAAACFLIAVVAATRDSKAEGGSNDDGLHGALVEPVTARPEFTLTDTSGRPYDFAAETQGRLTLLFFGYTHCPDVCPVQMATLAASLKTPGMPDPTVVFVTTDPERDDPARLREWLDQFDGDFVGLTGTHEEIAAAEAASHVPGSQVIPADGEDDSDYEVGHYAVIVAYTPDDLTHVSYPSGVRRQDWLNDLPILVERWGR